MIILSQDRDETFTLGNVYGDEKRTEDGKLMGFNVYGYKNEKGKDDVLLGTYDTDEDARILVEEIYRLHKANKVTHYSMPAPAMELSDLEEYLWLKNW